MTTSLPAINSAGPRTATVPLTGAQYRISAGDYRATIVELGAALRELHLGDRALVTSYDADELPPGAAGQLLTPWPNRIDRGRYSFAGTEYQLDISEVPRDTAIHGLTRSASWAPVHHEPDRVLLTHVLHGHPGYPFCLELDVEYRLDAGTGLDVRISARNVGTRTAPYGNGAHPYLTAGAPSVDACDVTIPAARRLPTDDRGIPSGPAQDVTGTPFDFRRARRIDGTRIDHAFTDLERDGDGRAWVEIVADGAGTVALWVDAGYPWLEVFTGDGLPDSCRRRALAVEPMTCPPNAFVTGEDVIVLEPGDTVTHSFGILRR